MALFVFLLKFFRGTPKEKIGKCQGLLIFMIQLGHEHHLIYGPRIGVIRQKAAAVDAYDAP